MLFKLYFFSLLTGQSAYWEVALFVCLTHYETSTNGTKVVLDRAFVNLGQVFYVNTEVSTVSAGGIHAFQNHALI